MNPCISVSVCNMFFSFLLELKWILQRTRELCFSRSVQLSEVFVTTRVKSLKEEKLGVQSFYITVQQDCSGKKMCSGRRRKREKKLLSRRAFFWNGIRSLDGWMRRFHPCWKQHFTPYEACGIPLPLEFATPSTPLWDVTKTFGSRKMSLFWVLITLSGQRERERESWR